MKLKVLAAFSIAAFTAAVHAQSSVTLYGALDPGITYVSNQGGHKNVEFQSGVMVMNVFGFRGSEDLGGGTSAIFDLENAFNLGTGASNGGLIFGHQAWAGLRNADWGTVTAGLQYEMMFRYLTIYRWGPELHSFSPYFTQAGPFQKLNMPVLSADFTRLAGSYPVANSVYYQSPDLNGFRFGAMYALGGIAGNIAQQNTVSFGMGYNRGPVELDAAYTFQRFPQISNGQHGILNAGTGGRFAVGQGYLDALYVYTQNTQNKGAVNTFALGGVYPVAQGATVGFNFQMNFGNAVLNNDVMQQVGLSLVQDLSKRTDVYANVVYQHARGDLGAMAYIPGSGVPSSSGNQTLVRIGLTTRF